MEYNGYSYRTAKTSLIFRYYKCKEGINNGCYGSVKVLNCGTIIAIKEHNHPPTINRRNLRKRLAERAQRDNHLSLRVIYSEESLRYPDEAQNYPYSTAESAMRSARRRIVPPLPQTLPELANVLEGNFGNHFSCHGGIFRGLVGDHSIILCCPHLLNDASDNGFHEIHADGTFKIRPSTPETRQVFTIHLIIQNHSIPLFLVMMKVRMMEAYMEVFQYIKSHYLARFHPSVIMTDYEKALQEALSREFVNSEIKGCHFHYVQAIWRKMSKLHLLTTINEDDEALIVLKMIMVLPLLPAERISEGLNIIQQYAISHNVEMLPLFQYVRRYWINNVTVNRMSVHGLVHRTNNNLESFHNGLKIAAGSSHPNLWKFLGIITKKIKESHIIINQIKRGHAVTRGSKNKFLLLDHRVKRAQQEFDRGFLTTLDFLKRCSHGVDRLEQRNRSWAVQHQNDTESSGDEGNGK